MSITRGQNVLVDRTFTGRVRIRLDTRRPTSYRVRTEVTPNEGYAGTVRVLRANVVLPRLLPAPAAQSRNSATGSAACTSPRPTGRPSTAGCSTPCTPSRRSAGWRAPGTVDGRFWTALAAARTPSPRYVQPASHLEVNKERQVLYVVRGSRVALIVPVSTAGVPGKFTPVGRFSIYRKVLGFDPSPLGTLYDPMYFTGGYAIHGNPSVPPYPASHGCVRVPMWVAPPALPDEPVRRDGVRVLASPCCSSPPAAARRSVRLQYRT